MRDLQVVIDEPIERGGTNLGPSPTEAAMASLIACTNVVGHKNARRLGIDLGEVTIDAAAKFDRRGVLMEEEIDLPFPAIALTVNCTTSASQQDLDRVGAETAKYCAIAKLFAAAGTDLTVNWVKTD
ncbi:OsmC family protein [Fluviibacterium sp. DFM31]|uniref:OsmC family protein n=1 Tax=Meridianimarinicoccus marinus TaxID=3231483 RepID=A0ABV3LBP8_9RHOB